MDSTVFQGNMLALPPKFQRVDLTVGNIDIAAFPQGLDAAKIAFLNISITGIPNGGPGQLVHFAAFQMKTIHMPQWVSQ